MWLTTLFAACAAATDPGALALLPVATGLERPVAVVAPPGDPRLFIVEQTGRIRVVRDGVLLEAPFADLSGLITTDGPEQGLLGLAFDPGYATSGRLFVNYTRKGGGDTVVAELRASADPDRAEPGAGVTVITFDQPWGNHNGGHLAFGPDGMLYIGTGDGGGSDDPHGNGQAVTTLLGKMLRIDVSALPYTVPPTNPFVGRAGTLPEIWATGLRNPWRYSFDRATGDLYIGDVGQREWEEIDVQPAASTGGENYGWNTLEGTHCFASSGCSPAGTVLPIVDYSHRDGCSVTGGVVYRGKALPALVGRYLYSDYCRDWIRSVRWVGGEATDAVDLTDDLDPGHKLLRRVSSFGEDAAGEVYVVSHGGTVFRIVPE